MGQELYEFDLLVSEDDQTPKEEKALWIFLLPHFLQTSSSFLPPIPKNKSNLFPQSLQT